MLDIKPLTPIGNFPLHSFFTFFCIEVKIFDHDDQVKPPEFIGEFVQSHKLLSTESSANYRRIRNNAAKQKEVFRTNW